MSQGPVSVSDSRSNKNEQILHAAEVIGRSAHRRLVFEAVYYHKKRTKTVTEIVARTQLPRVRVLQEGRRLVQQHVIGQTKSDGDIAYVQDPFFQANKKQILALVDSKPKREEWPSKRSPHAVNPVSRSRSGSAAATAKYITVDEIDSFSRVRNVPPLDAEPLSEEAFKLGLQAILDEEGEFKDWGGEDNDLFTPQLVLW